MPLVTYDEQCDFLDVPAGTDEDLIGQLLVQTTALFEKECGRATAPFAAAQTGRIEILEGNIGSAVLTLDYPIATVTSIVTGKDVALPDETLSPSDPQVVVWRVGSRDIVRTDGGVWRRYLPRWVKVVYNTQADFPEDVKLAVKRMVASVYMGRDKLGFTSITRGAKSWTMAQTQATQDVFWQGAVANHRRVWVR